MTHDDLEIVHDALDAQGVPINAEATPAQMLAMLKTIPDDVAERLIEYWHDRLRGATDCWLRNHEQQINHWRERALAAEAAVRPSGPASGGAA